MANSVATGAYNKQLWEAKLSERLNKPTTWRDVADVRMADMRSLHVSYKSTENSTQNGTRGTAFSASDFALTDEILTLSELKIAPIYVDYADNLQSDYVKQVEQAEDLGIKLSEDIETAMLDDHANWTNVGLSGSDIVKDVETQIDVTATTIDDIVRSIRQIVIEANGMSLMERNGLFFVWRAKDLAKLEAFAQANGFNLADYALKNGISNAYNLLGATHYVSNSNVANHVFCGVKKIFKIGLLRGTWGRMYEQPGVNSDGPLSGTLLHARADFGTLSPAKHVPVLYDLNVA